MTVERDPQSSLPPEAIQLLEELWGEIQSKNREVSRERLRAVARQVSLCAVETGLRSEELIIAVKESWNAPGGPAEPPERLRLQSVFADTISLCIDEFYRALREFDVRRGAPDRWRLSGADSPSINP